MRTNYKRLGDYIEQVNVRNTDLKVTKLYGLSMTKEFRETTSNTVGTDMSKYKIMQKYQFACDFMSPIRVNKLPVVLKLDNEPNLVSPAYPVFQIKDKNKLNPKYLMMWFRRDEFDRYVTFKSDSAIRGGYGWTELCDLELPVPPIEEQEKIVAEYQAIENKIKVNQQICEKLEATAQAIYKEWFVEFNFPFDFAQGKPDKNGKPYKDNGGKMVWNEELEKEVPEGWEVVTFDEFIKISSGKLVRERVNDKDDIYKYPIYGAGGVMGFSKSFLLNEKLLSIGRVGTHGVVQRIDFPCWLTDNTLIIVAEYYEYVYQILLNINYDEINRGGVQGLITQTDIKNIPVIKSSRNTLNAFEKIASGILSFQYNFHLENQKLTELKSLLLARMVK